MKIKKSILKTITIWSIFIFCWFNFTYLVTLNNPKLSWFWKTYNIKTYINQVSAENEENKENEEEENEIKKSFEYNSKAVDPKLKKLENTYEFQNIWDSTRSINWISWASVVWESSEDKKTLSTINYYSKGKKLKKDFKKNTKSILPKVTSNIVPVIIPQNNTQTNTIPTSKPVPTIKKSVPKPTVVPIQVPTPDPAPAQAPKPTPPTIIQPVPTPAPTPMPVPDTTTKPS